MFNKIAIFFGGYSYERKISLQSGKEVFYSLKKIGINSDLIDIKNFSFSNFKKMEYFKAFIVAHGGIGENGILQKKLEFLNLPYTGSNVSACSISINKLETKKILSKIGLPIIPYYILNKKTFNIYKKNFLNFIDNFGFPIIIKPIFEGSSIGVVKIKNLFELKKALELTFFYGENILVEKFINGLEYTVVILGDEIFPSIRIQPENSFYDYYSKYISKKTEYFCPSGLNVQEETKIKDIAFLAYKTIGCSGCVRVDIIQDKNGFFYILEINTSPGMTKRSLVPLSAEKLGIDFCELLIKILELKNKKNIL